VPSDVPQEIYIFKLDQPLALSTMIASVAVAEFQKTLEDAENYCACSLRCFPPSAIDAFVFA